MIDQWADLEQLRDDGQRILHWIRRQGVVMCCEPAERKRAKEILLPVFQALSNAIRALPLCAVYLYRQSDQPSGLRLPDGTPMQYVDGIDWLDATPDRGHLHAIGLSCETLNEGAEYAQLIFLHELSHIIYGKEHSVGFHRHLDMFIAQVNQATGTSIVNDYFGLPRTDTKALKDRMLIEAGFFPIREKHEKGPGHTL